MRLYFLRHGLADRSAWSGSDFERPLTPEGVARMESSAATMDRLGLDLDLLVTSPVVRARQTADIVARFLGVQRLVVEDPRLGHAFGPAALSGVLEDHEGRQRVMLVGHEPGFSATIGTITGGDVVVKKGSLARVDVDRVRPLNGSLVWLVPPKVLAL
jgi:phosphohistidine phosphatase